VSAEDCAARSAELFLHWAGSGVTKVFEDEAVVPLEHRHAGAALVGDLLAVLAGANTEADPAATKCVWRGTADS
jgi:hypothetical protein